MKARRTLVIVLALLGVIAGGVFVLQPATQPALRHGTFATRFQPAPPASSSNLAQQRQAGIGNVKDLRPMEIPSR